MIEIGNKRWRNLQEQVAWLTAMIGQATDVVKNVQGIVADAASLPDASTFSNGTTYAVGAASPYEYYVAINGSWLDIGTFPLEGPAGTDGTDGKSIFITSQATTSGTTQILIASVYNPASLTIDAGDLILSEQGDIFAVTGSSVSTLYVVYRCNIKGPQGATGATGPAGADGADGTNVLTSSATTTSGTTAIQTSTINVPTGYTAKAGDMIVTSTGDVFISTGPSSLPGYTDVTYCYNIKGAAGSPGTPGADGATWYEGSDMIYDSVGNTYDLSTTDAPGIAVGDLYLITTNYTSDGHDFTKGDIFTVSSIAGTTCDCAFVCSILGPQGNTGATGADGATWYSGTDVIHTGGSGGAYVIPLSSLPDLKVGDLYLVTSTYTSDGETLNNGDVWAVYSIADPYAVMTFRANIEGPSGSAAWGSITGTLSYQTDLQNALNGKLSLSGGTMTGDINMTGHRIMSRGNSVFQAGDSSNALIIGNDSLDRNLIIRTGTGFNITHQTGGGAYTVLDTDNTQANPTLAGTEADLTGLKINGTSYKVPSGGGGSIYQHNVYIVNNAFTSRVAFSIVNSTSTPYTTIAEIAAAVKAVGLDSDLKTIIANGIYRDGSANYLIMSIYSTDGTNLAYVGPLTTNLSANYYVGDMNLGQIRFFSDTVIQII